MTACRCQKTKRDESCRPTYHLPHARDSIPEGPRGIIRTARLNAKNVTVRCTGKKCPGYREQVLSPERLDAIKAQGSISNDPLVSAVQPAGNFRQRVRLSARTGERKTRNGGARWRLLNPLI